MSNDAALTLKKLARQLLTYEATSEEAVDATDSATFRVCERLRGPLSILLGIVGFRSLLSRALALASAESPCLGALQLSPNGLLEGLDRLEATPDPRAVAQGEVVLVSHLLGLLVTFIGPSLTLGLLRDIWSKKGDIDF